MLVSVGVAVSASVAMSTGVILSAGVVVCVCRFCNLSQGVATLSAGIVNVSAEANVL